MTGNKKIASRILSLPPSGIEVLLTMLFNEEGYRIREVMRQGKQLFFHLADTGGGRQSSALACFIPDAKNLTPELLGTIHLTPPLARWSEIAFENKLVIHPGSIPDGFERTAKELKIELLDGEGLARLLADHELTGLLPVSRLAIMKDLWTKAWVALPVLLLALVGFFAFKAWQTPKATAPPPPPVASVPAPSPARESGTRLPSPFQQTPLRVPPPVIQPQASPYPKPVSPKPIPKPASKQRVSKGGNRKQVIEKILRRYRKVYDLEEKYYRIGRDFDTRKYKDLARKYYRLSLHLAPKGVHAHKMRLALKRLAGQTKPVMKKRQIPPKPKRIRPGHVSSPN